MLPKFPAFIRLSIKHKPFIEKQILRFPPYSDFNFTSLISWSDQDTAISQLNENLIVKFKDYLTDEPFLTFIGNNKVSETISTLLNHSNKIGLSPKLKLIPEATLKEDIRLKEQFDIKEDKDNFDYIYLLEEAKEFRGNKHRDKRNFVNRFKRLYKSRFQLLDLKDKKTQQQMLKLFNHWGELNGKNEIDFKNELLAIKKLFSYSKHLDLICIGIYVNENLIGFSINEVLRNGYAMNLFEKADKNYQGIFPYLRQISAIYLLELGCKYLNHEQDLGIESLRKSKQSYNQHTFLKKYTVLYKKAPV